MPSISNGGKGDKPRPYSVDSETFASNWERTFGVQGVHGDALPDGEAHGPGEVQAPDTPTTGA